MILVRVAGDHRRVICDSVDVGFDVDQLPCFDAQSLHLE